MQMHVGHHAHIVGAELGVPDGSKSSFRICVLHLKLAVEAQRRHSQLCSNICTECVYIEMVLCCLLLLSCLCSNVSQQAMVSEEVLLSCSEAGPEES